MSDITSYFTNDPSSLFDEIAQPTLSVTQSERSFPLPDTSHLLEEELPRLNVPNEVIDMWESPTQVSGGPPPPLTLPGIFTSSDYQDYIKEVAENVLGPDSVAKRSELLTENDVTQDDRGLRHLITSGCFRAALNLTSRLLSIYGQGYNKFGQVSKNTSHSLGLWFTRLALFLKLGQYELAIKEAEAFGKLDRPDVFYEHYTDLYGGRQGSMACFSFRVLLAELPIYRSNYREALNNLTDLLDVCERIYTHFKSSSKANEEAAKFWRKRANRTIHSIINCAILMKNFSLAADLLKRLVSQEGMEANEKQAVQLALSRVYLQCGDIFSAETVLNEVFPTSKGEVNISEFINRGLLKVAKGEFEDALKLFQTGLEIQPKNIMLHNNVAVCLLYTGKLKASIKQYEEAININPRQALHENLILNLCTLYELESNDARAKKLNLLRKLAAHKPDINCSIDMCLKIDYKRPEEIIMKPEKKEAYVV